MRKMKKMFTLILAVAMLISMNITAFAAEPTQEAGDFSLDGIVVIVTHEEDESQDVCGVISCDGADVAFAAYAASAKTYVEDLGTSGSKELTWNVNSESTIRSNLNYKTNSEQLKVKLKGDISTSVTLKLYKSDGTEVASKTDTVGTFFNTTFTFTNLSSANEYYFRLTNNDQHDVAFTGTISAK